MTAFRVKRAPAVIAGALFCFLAVPVCAEPATLALDLYLEGAWRACGREAERVLVRNPDHGLAKAISAAARIRLMPANTASVWTDLAALSTNGALSSEGRALAAYEWGRALWQAGRRAAARSAFTLALDATGRESPLSPAIALGLFQSLTDSRVKADRQRAEELAEMWRNTWTRSVREHARLEVPAGPGFFSLPGDAIIWFYRSQVRPAIGDRCKLEPSCSEYFRQASRRYGLLAFPMIADRGVREPSVVSAARQPLWSGREWRFADPLDGHDFWLARPGAGCACPEP